MNPNFSSIELKVVVVVVFSIEISSWIANNDIFCNSQQLSKS